MHADMMVCIHICARTLVWTAVYVSQMVQGAGRWEGQRGGVRELTQGVQPTACTHAHATEWWRGESHMLQWGLREGAQDGAHAGGRDNVLRGGTCATG